MQNLRIFREAELRELLDSKRKDLVNEIVSADKNYILNVNESEYVKYLVNRYQVELLFLDFDSISISNNEKMVPAEQFPSEFYNILPGKSYRKPIIIYHIPYSGNEELLRYLPTQYFLNSDLYVYLKDQCICFELINFDNNLEKIRKEEENSCNYIKYHGDMVNNDIKKFNQDLENLAIEYFNCRKNDLLKQENFIQSLGVPIRKSENVPSTFAIPAVKKKVVITKPSAPNTAYKPEPTLDNSIYQAILKIIQHTGIEMERLPDIYQGKGEETLRNHFIMVLSPNFESTTGETFNKLGKTDILIRHEQKNVFIAECKFWTGIKGFFDTIDQLLGYLTWRDSKAAIICFVKNNELTPVLQKIEEQTKDHPCFVKYLGKQDDAWFNFDFHLKDDPSRNIKLAVLCFHFPPS